MTPAGRRRVIEAVTRERARCARILEVSIQRLGGVGGPPEDNNTVERILWTVLCDRLDRIRRPWAVRRTDPPDQVIKYLPRRRRCCGICGSEDHTAPRHNSVTPERVS
jgi:hypothetical protein